MDSGLYFRQNVSSSVWDVSCTNLIYPCSKVKQQKSDSFNKEVKMLTLRSFFRFNVREALIGRSGPFSR